jgi:hypothetical protein
MKHYCELLIADNGQVCLPFPEWRQSPILRECGHPAMFRLDYAPIPVWICAEHWDRVEAQKRNAHNV